MPQSHSSLCLPIEGETEGALAWQACGRWEFARCEPVHDVTFGALTSKGTKPVVISFSKPVAFSKTSSSCDSLVLVQSQQHSTFPRYCPEARPDEKATPVAPTSSVSNSFFFNAGRVTSQHPHGKLTLIEKQEQLYRPPAARSLQEGRRFDIEGTQGAVAILRERVQGCVSQNSDPTNPILREVEELGTGTKLNSGKQKDNLEALSKKVNLTSEVLARPVWRNNT